MYITFNGNWDQYLALLAINLSRLYVLHISVSLDSAERSVFGNSELIKLVIGRDPEIISTRSFGYCRSLSNHLHPIKHCSFTILYIKTIYRQKALICSSVLNLQGVPIHKQLVLSKQYLPNAIALFKWGETRF